MSFQDYIKDLPISSTFKEQILSKNFIENNPVYYQNYPSLFVKAFSIQNEQIELLDIAGFLYYQATIFTDSLIDEKDLSKFPLISVCQEESIKILSNIFDLNSSFWSLWNVRKNEYLQAIQIEKQLQQKQTDITIEEYENLADLKSTFGKVAIDCLFSLEENQNIEVYNQLLLSHKYFSVAFQLNDDIQDFKIDYKNNQFNWAVYLLKQQDIPTQNPNILEKYLYIRGISKKLYQLGIYYSEKALYIVRDIDVPNWKKVLKDTIKSFQRAIIEIDNYLEILTSEIYLSNTLTNKDTLNISINNALQFVKKKQNNDGSWREYVNQGGISNAWSTAFILSKISENDILKTNFKEEISRGLGFIQNNSISNLWSYNTTWIEDADSTNFVLLSYALNDVLIDNNIIESWFQFQKKDGGFSTYSNKDFLLKSLDDKNISKVEGWLTSHNCVSAVSFFTLTKLGLVKNNSNFNKLKSFFENKLDTNIDSYWWTSPIYTLYYLAKTYYTQQENEKFNLIVKKIQKLQNEDGSFCDNYGVNHFYTGLALEILLLDSNSETEIKKAVDYLLSYQFTDGSWENSNALQVPNSNDIIPSKSFFPVSTYGMNVRAKEFNRLFTTVSILSSLLIYEQRFNTNYLK